MENCLICSHLMPTVQLIDRLACILSNIYLMYSAPWSVKPEATGYACSVDKSSIINVLRGWVHLIISLFIHDVIIVFIAQQEVWLSTRQPSICHWCQRQDYCVPTKHSNDSSAKCAQLAKKK